MEDEAGILIWGLLAP